MTEKTFAYNGATYTINTNPTNRQREDARQLWRKLQDLDLTPSTVAEFSSLVVYTVDVKGNGWRPPSPQAAKEDIIAALEEWFDQPAAFTEQWLNAFGDESDPITGPIALPEDAPGNL